MFHCAVRPLAASSRCRQQDAHAHAQKAGLESAKREQMRGATLLALYNGAVYAYAKVWRLCPGHYWRVVWEAAAEQGGANSYPHVDRYVLAASQHWSFPPKLSPKLIWIPENLNFLSTMRYVRSSCDYTGEVLKLSIYYSSRNKSAPESGRTVGLEFQLSRTVVS